MVGETVDFTEYKQKVKSDFDGLISPKYIALKAAAGDSTSGASDGDSVQVDYDKDIQPLKLTITYVENHPEDDVDVHVLKMTDKNKGIVLGKKKDNLISNKGVFVVDCSGTTHASGNVKILLSGIIANVNVTLKDTAQTQEIKKDKCDIASIFD